LRIPVIVATNFVVIAELFAERLRVVA